MKRLHEAGYVIHSQNYFANWPKTNENTQKSTFQAFIFACFISFIEINMIVYVCLYIYHLLLFYLKEYYLMFSATTSMIVRSCA